MRDVLFFDSMLTPKFITFVYWLLLAGVAWSGLKVIFGGFGFSFEKLILGLLMMVTGAVGARIWCELLIVLFKIHDNVKKIAEK
ncbi:hypothetical protein Enr10x_26590 [Gimesia panareensis]|uniref:DUF4282 domain-containing protein n=1 Tax=Gimesia panareensis TaxID=2527978 RepID=A0A517Q6S8_9PLAN|nr:DUF4282 domain-containing protein [Gimesia panareensis]QDT27342.1 hypothetical protein Enr10x_26590 [Gimesia panareensis]